MFFLSSEHVRKWPKIAPKRRQVGSQVTVSLEYRLLNSFQKYKLAKRKCKLEYFKVKAFILYFLNCEIASQVTGFLKYQLNEYENKMILKEIKKKHER